MQHTCTQGEVSAYNAFEVQVQVKGEQSIMQVLTGPEVCRCLRLSEFLGNRCMKMAWLSALGTGRLYPTGDTPSIHFSWGLSRFHGYSAAGRVKPMKIPSNPTGNRTCDIPACNAVPQPDAF